jgi:hypothetical protein
MRMEEHECEEQTRREQYVFFGKFPHYSSLESSTTDWTCKKAVFYCF